MPTNRVYRVAVIPGDGIGKEVVPEGLRVARGRGGALRHRAQASTGISTGVLRLLRASTAA